MLISRLQNVLLFHGTISVSRLLCSRKKSSCLKPVKPIFTFRGPLVNYEIQFNRESKLLGVKHGVQKGEGKKKKKRYYGFLSFFFLPAVPSTLRENINPQIRRRTFNNRLCKSTRRLSRKLSWIMARLTRDQIVAV